MCIRDRVNQLLSLPADHIFTLPEQIIQTKQIRQPVKETISIPRSLPDRTTIGQIFVSTNIIEPSFYGSSSKNILRIFERKIGVNTRHHVAFNPIYYQPLQKSDFRTVQITLNDEFGLFLPDLKFPTTAVLHVRREQL